MILRQPKWDEIFDVHVDASNMALGAILAQPKRDLDFPAYFASRKFSQAEKKSTRNGVCIAKIPALAAGKPIHLLCRLPSSIIIENKGSNSGAAL